MKYISVSLAFVIVTWVVAPGWAQANSGFYVSGEVGANYRQWARYHRNQQRPGQLCAMNTSIHDTSEYERCTGP